MSRVLPLLVIALAGCGAGAGDDAPPVDLPDGGPAPLAFTPPRNPHLADSTWPIFHRDSYAQHSSELRGVEGQGAVDVTVVPTAGIPIFVLFDPDDDILTVTKGVAGASLYKIDRETLTVVASVPLAAGDTFAGAYGYLDAQGRAVVGVGKQISRYLAGAATLELEASVDLSATLGGDEALVAITVLYSGEIAFVGSAGTVGVVASSLGSGGSGGGDALLDVLALPGEQVSNGLTTDETGGIFVVTSAALHRLDWSGTELTASWSHPVAAPFSEPRPGRLGIGSGTTPALVMDDLVAITDDEESMNLLLVRRAPDPGGAPREACKLQVFDGPATTDNAIVVAGRTLIIEQNLEGHAGVARVDVDASGACRHVWTADVHAPTCVPTLSTASNLAYVYTDDDGDWGLTGLDLSTGRRVFKASAGTTGIYNNYYAAVTIGPDRRIYVGTIAGLVVFADVAAAE